MVGAMKIGIDSYSFHRFYHETTQWETPSAVEWDTVDFFRFCESVKVDVASLQTIHLDTTRAGIDREIASWRQATGCDVILTWGHPNGFDGGRNLERLANAEIFLEFAGKLGIREMRIVCGNHNNFFENTSQRNALLRPLIKHLVNRASELQVRISIENHADFCLADLVEYVSSFDTPHLGLCLDMGNALRVGDDPIRILDQLDLDKVFMIQMKEIIMVEGHEAPTGWWPTVKFGSGDVHVEECMKILKKRNYTQPVVVELSNLFGNLQELEVARDAVQYLRLHA